VFFSETGVKVYLVLGKTDMRKGIDGLATLIQDSFKMDPYGDSIFLFSGWSKDRYKCLYFAGDGFASLDNGKLQWPKDENEVRTLSQQELCRISLLLLYYLDYKKRIIPS